ncbi:hypothetical protein BCU30_021805 [Vibrio lentus]|uniref:hypothetical protein n=1 Tax=Vibrio TaxID=662 RepID=UPI000C852937|nr:MULTISPECIES: hypothetical protein [Vibrio]MBU2907874.1 hypothetical protein [Vibrio splendidus]MDO6530185.1 hypothetical protein [Vibrio splendidus]MDO6551240.1 hypothetical protein [Vibrio splendidus]PMJ11351.1 hypothetical protein BCU30_06705 [Vibrio lentus]
MAYCQCGDFVVLEHVKVIAFESEPLFITPSLEGWNPNIQIMFSRDRKNEKGRLLEFFNHHDTAVLQFTNWHSYSKKSLLGPYELGESPSGSKISVFIVHEFIDEEPFPTHSIELQFMEGGEDDFENL